MRLGSPARTTSQPTSQPSVRQTRPTRPTRLRQRQRGRGSVGLGRSPVSAPATTTTRSTTTQSLFQTSFTQPAQPRQPVQPVQSVQSGRVIPSSDLAAALVTPTGSRQPTRVTPSQGQGGEDKEYFYEYYYDYLEDDSQGHATDYDLVPLANKVSSIGPPQSLILSLSGENIIQRSPSLPGRGGLPSSFLLQEICQLLQKSWSRHHRINLPMSFISRIRPCGGKM